ncbi:MAG: alkaline phosphatase family protein [Myxococcales bacterium]
MSTRSLVVGLDGADLEIVLALGRERLPELFALMDRGVFAHQLSVQPPATLPNWTTFLTGVDPGRHGVFDFTVRDGYAVAFRAGTVRETPTWIARLDRLGMRCACVGFPATWPPERLRHGVFISGWDAPVAFEADASFVWPRALYGTLMRRFAALRFDEVDQFRADAPGFHAALGDSLVAKVEARSDLASYLLAMRRWDVFAFYFGESDTASHYLWSLHDEGAPRRPARVSASEATGLTRVYQQLDRALGRLVREAGPDVEITVVSDHGSGGSSDKVVYLNRALAQLGLLSFKPNMQRANAAGGVKRLALERLSPRWRDRLFRAAGARLPSWLESRARFARIDMARTQAFSDELNYFPAVHFNVKGREPQGTVEPTQLPALRARVTEGLLSLRDPFSGRPLVTRVMPREELFDGPWVQRAPDLLLELRLDRGYSYNLMPSPSAGSDIVVRLEPHDYLGKKGRSLPGSHRPRGLFIAAGPRVAARGQIEATIADAAASVLSRLDVAPPEHAAGSVPHALDAGGPLRDLPEAAPRLVGLGDQGALERRLRALGYVD